MGLLSPFCKKAEQGGQQGLSVTFWRTVEAPVPLPAGQGGDPALWLSLLFYLEALIRCNLTKTQAEANAHLYRQL
ncbi:hypothetical protein HM1_1464 [Heliomicrobium modesticaldum Ice1]|uniref:Uncharacterized protein n=1 Tax=Heliobacterium modesticaldum (strain ATCC 51547 / Ice1) TaxID=498761 RepID=B0TCL1_HELMI|nr:hypothetical protein HM1_1464 [Heliomicrobium modesticaldum Ice1]